MAIRSTLKSSILALHTGADDPCSARRCQRRMALQILLSTTEMTLIDLLQVAVDYLVNRMLFVKVPSPHVANYAFVSVPSVPLLAGQGVASLRCGTGRFPLEAGCHQSKSSSNASHSQHPLVDFDLRECACVCSASPSATPDTPTQTPSSL